VADLDDRPGARVGFSSPSGLAEFDENMTARTIIVPLDGSGFAERAVPVARSIASRIHAGLIVMSTRWADAGTGLGPYLDRVGGESGVVPVESVLVDEHPAASAITSVSRAHPDSIVCMTSHGRSGARWALLGSVTEEVVREAHVPMLLVGRHCAIDWPTHIEHLVLCVDGSDVAEPDIPALSEWAKALGLDVRVVLVTHPFDVETATHPNQVIAAIAAGFATYGVSADAVTLRSSYAAGAIADYARTLPATLVATGTSSRRGLARVALGSVAMGVVSLAPCPVMVTPSRR
jgi:nucleotide-binding universal stress UspA family protein